MVSKSADTQRPKSLLSIFSLRNFGVVVVALFATLLAALLPILSIAAAAPVTAIQPEPEINTELDAVPTDWQLSEFSMSTQGLDKIGGYVLYAPAAQAPIAFHCTDSNFTALIGTAPQFIRPAINEMGEHSWEKYTVRVKVGMDSVLFERWLLLKSQNLAMPMKQKTSRKIFNAGLRGEAVSISIDDGPDFKIEPPKPNTALFTQFLNDCAVAGKS